MKTRLLIILLFMLAAIVVIPAMAQNDDCVELDIEIESTKNLDWKACYLKDSSSLLIKTSSEESTENKIILQKDVFWNYDVDCSPTRFFTLINDEEIYQQEEYFDDYRILYIPLEKGENEVEIIIATIPGLTANEYCLTEFAEPIQQVKAICEGPEVILVDGICLVQTTDSEHYINTSPYYQALLMMGVFLWPFFISGAAIFIVLAKTPRYKKSTRIAVTLFGSLVIVWFLIMMFIGIWPQMGA